MRTSALFAAAILLAAGAGRPALAAAAGSTDTGVIRSMWRNLRPAVGQRSTALRSSQFGKAAKTAPVRLQWKSARTSKKRLRREQEGSRISAYCFCAEIDVDAVSEATIAQDGRLWAGRSYGDVWHLSSPRSPLLFGEEALKQSSDSDIFIMPYGCVVFWNLRADEENSFLELLKPFASELVEKREFDFLTLASNATSCSTSTRKVSEDSVTLETDLPAEKLAISFGLAQSVKLSALEEQLDETVSDVRHIPEEMSRNGRVRFSEREVSKLTGRLFLFRSEVNLYSDILDGQPTWFWDNEDFASQYEQTSQYLDLSNRVDVYNQRLDIVGELVENLNDRLNHKDSAKLEWIIIWLITVEIIMGLLPETSVVGIIPRLVGTAGKLFARGVAPL
ncbi:hypothetical protein T492DRAFT_1068467 [Pavlovales sp. CCMP2436]|nr:hypothetical protein T492DRAFT_1068467 [Pavlovales sp. CCMP2436]